MRFAAALLFSAGAALGFDLTWWLTHDHCKWSPLTCIHFWHHALFAGAYLFVAWVAWRRIREGV